MPESETHIIDAVTKLDARPEDTAFAFRQESEEAKSRINILFGKEETKSADSLKKGTSAYQKEHEGFDNVNEGVTSDTTEAPGTQ